MAALTVKLPSPFCGGSGGVDKAHVVMEPVPPELDNEKFLGEVLELTPENADAFLDELVAKAAAMGISKPNSTTDNFTTLCAQSSITLDTSHVRTGSTGSQASASTTLTSASSSNGAPNVSGQTLSRKRSKVLTFTQYEKYLAQIEPNLIQPKFLQSQLAKEANPTLSRARARQSYLGGLTNGFPKIHWRRKSAPICTVTISCCACRDDFNTDQALQKLPCGHTYCAGCLRIMINQSTKDESKMPPRCCAQPIPSSIVKAVLSREEQIKFLKAVLQFSTPWETRIFCPNTSCGEFIPPRNKVDPKHPFEVICRQCRTRVCSMCKRDTHPIGQDCPGDWELDAVLKMGEKSGWRRCYKCKTLVELSMGCTHMTCRCRAQFCYICGAIWDPRVGCPNLCNGEEELERRQREEEQRVAELEAEEAARKASEEEEAAARLEAENRTAESSEFQCLKSTQAGEMERFLKYEKRTKWLMWARHARQKQALVGKQSSTVEKMKDRHLRTATNLDDRQVAAEMELRANLEQSERNIRIRLKHMEAYCDGLGHNPSGNMPARVVTERDLRELGQQYNVEKNMKQLHQAKINVMRDRQAKAFEELLERQAVELERFLERNEKEVENLESLFGDEEDAFAAEIIARKIKLQVRWELQALVLVRELEGKTGLRHGKAPSFDWPTDRESINDSVAAVEG